MLTVVLKLHKTVTSVATSTKCMSLLSVSYELSNKIAQQLMPCILEYVENNQQNALNSILL
jgi:hypothetical protein